jgi:hypothetical protein
MVRDASSAHLFGFLELPIHIDVGVAIGAADVLRLLPHVPRVRPLFDPL